MARLEVWFLEFADRHQERFPRPDWPGIESEFWDGWATALRRHGVHEGEADAASLLLVESPPDHLGQHLAALLSLVKQGWKTAKIGDVPDRETAREASRDCEHCGGEGMLGVQYPPALVDGGCPKCGEVPQGRSTCERCYPKAKADPYTVAAHCVCPYGRWLRRALDGDPATQSRIVDLGRVLSGQSVFGLIVVDVPPEPAGFNAAVELRKLADHLRSTRHVPAPAVRPLDRMTEAQDIFADRLGFERRERFRLLPSAQRELVMRAEHDPVLRDEAVRLIGPKGE